MYPVRSKYRAKRTSGFASKAEFKRYTELTWLLNAGNIAMLECQPVFLLQEAFEVEAIPKAVKHRKITYKADFIYFDNELNEYVVEDTKGYRTDLYMMKKKIFLYQRYDPEDKCLYFRQNDARGNLQGASFKFIES
jgi:hypothetical protein